MQRRTFLTGSALAAGTALAGCSAPGQSQSLGQPREEADGPRERHLIFERDGESVVTLTLQQRQDPSPPLNRFQLRFVVSHTDDTRIQALQFDLRSPLDPAAVPADVYLKQPDGGPWPALEFRSVENNWTRIAVDGLDDLGRGTLGLEVIVAPRGESPETVGIRSELELGTTGPLSGGPFRAEAGTEFDPVVDTE